MLGRVSLLFVTVSKLQLYKQDWLCPPKIFFTRIGSEPNVVVTRVARSGNQGTEGVS